MRKVMFGGLLLPFIVALVLASPQSGAAQAKASGNLFKDIMDHKDALNWKNAPDTLPPSEVCNLLQSCGGPAKVVVQVPVTEAGRKITRALILSKSQDAKHSDQLILFRQSATEAYFFLLSPDGNMAKAAYGETGKQWQVIGNTVGQPVFDPEKKNWSAAVAKVGSAPAAAAPAAPAAEDKQ
jgi:hypothetical protein